MSCKKAQAVFEQKNAVIDTRADARKEKIDADQAWEFLSKAARVHIGKGKKVVVFEPLPENREAILKAAMGRSGNLRAPALKVGDQIYIGFNDDLYGSL